MDEEDRKSLADLESMANTILDQASHPGLLDLARSIISQGAEIRAVVRAVQKRPEPKPVDDKNTGQYL